MSRSISLLAVLAWSAPLVALATLADQYAPGLGSHSLELVADVFNLPNLLDHDWGQVRHTVEDFGAASTGNRAGLLELVGYDQARGRGVYKILAPGRREVDIDATRWRMRFSLRYVF